MREESKNSSAMRRLAGGEHRRRLTLAMEKRGRKLQPSTLFIVGGEREMSGRAHESTSRAGDTPVRWHPASVPLGTSPLPPRLLLGGPWSKFKMWRSRYLPMGCTVHQPGLLNLFFQYSKLP
jgi:hypothetical protein